MTLHSRFALLFAVLISSTAFGAKAEMDSGKMTQLKELNSRVKYESGEIKLRDNLATINLTPDYKYVNQAGTDTILYGIWGNPPSQEKSLGMIVPANFSPFDPDSWAVIVSYTGDGYVKDHDAETINYDKLLKEMQEGTREASKERVKQGYPGIELVGWAKPPTYDKESHKFVWAKEIKFEGGEADNTLNYNIRVLGRGGILVLNAVAGMSALPKIEAAAPDILKMVNFDAGNRYADFKPGSDKVATYGLAALVAGGIAAKTGLLKGLLVALIAAKKLIVVGVIAVVAMVKKIFGKKD